MSTKLEPSDASVTFFAHILKLIINDAYNVLIHPVLKLAREYLIAISVENMFQGSDLTFSWVSEIRILIHLDIWLIFDQLGCSWPSAAGP